MAYTYEYFQAAADFLRTKTDITPEIGIVLGSCLGPFAQAVENPVTVDYAEIPHFLLSTVASHAGKLIFGTVAGRRVVCMSGRFHSYEGYSFEELVIPIRVLKLLGIRAAVLTNAAGAVNRDYRPGDVMVIRDHIKLNGDSPLRGPNVEDFGPRFFDVSRMYTPELRKLALDCAKGSPLRVHEGTYMFFPGPQFETPAEIRAARLLGADAVGMSTVPEAIVAVHAGMKVLGFSLLSNMGAGILDQPLSGEEVNEMAEACKGPFSKLVLACLEKM